MQFKALVLAAVVTLLAAASAAARRRPPARRPATRRRRRRSSAARCPQLADVVPFPGGEAGEVTTDQAYAYMEAVDRASDRVITGALGQRTWQSRELR